MDNPPLLHDLLYINEHLNCPHYVSDVDTGFVYKEFEAGSSDMRKHLVHYHLLFFLEGECTIRCDHYPERRFRGGEMILLPMGGVVFARADTRVRVLDMIFDQPVSACDKLFLSHSRSLVEGSDYSFRALEIRYPLTALLDLLLYYLQNGASCSRIHEIKHREVFFCLRGFYTKEEIAELFHPLVSRSMDFRNSVYRILPDVCSVGEMTERMGMHKNTFIKKFKREFGETPHRWLLKHVCRRIVADCMLPEITVKDIMCRNRFSSMSNFTRFCRRNFGCTPSELVDRCRRSGAGELPAAGAGGRSSEGVAGVGGDAAAGTSEGVGGRARKRAVEAKI